MLKSKNAAYNKLANHLTYTRGRGVLRISSDGDDRMGAKIKTQKNSLGLPAKPNLVKLGQLYLVFLLLLWPPFSPCPGFHHKVVLDR